MAESRNPRIAIARARRDDDIRVNVGATAWMDRARCIGVNADIKNSGNAQRFAERYCAACPVKEECLAYGIATKATSIVYGGVYFNGEGVPNLRWTDHPIEETP